MNQQQKYKSYYTIKEPYQIGMLKVSSIHTIYYEISGNPIGKPALILHGGPGAGSSPNYRGIFDPDFYQIIQFDQRGCGISKPFNCLNENTTWDLVSDIEKLRNHLNIEKWYIVLGGSWGSTLSLAYSQKHNDKVERLVLRGVFFATKKELDFLYQTSTPLIFPEYYENFIKLIPNNERNDMLKAYYKRIHSNDKDRVLYCKAWTRWEMATSKLFIDEDSIKESEDEMFAEVFASIETHYFINNAFFDSDNYLLDNCFKIKDIPTIIVQGRYDMLCPMKYAYDLMKRLNNCVLDIIPDAGHSAAEPGIIEGLVKATDLFKI